MDEINSWKLIQEFSRFNDSLDRLTKSYEKKINMEAHDREVIDEIINNILNLKERTKNGG